MLIIISTASKLLMRVFALSAGMGAPCGQRPCWTLTSTVIMYYYIYLAHLFAETNGNVSYHSWTYHPSANVPGPWPSVHRCWLQASQKFPGETSPHIQRAWRDQRKKEDIPGCWVTVLTSKGILHRKLVWGRSKMSGSPHSPTKSWKFI